VTVAGAKMPTDAVTTYLDFGMTRRGKRTCYDYREGQQAYDLFMGARYLNDLIAYREGRVEAVYHPEDVRDNLRKHTALTVCNTDVRPPVYYEIGSSVMGAIDGINYINGQYGGLDTRRITWYGVDNSHFMNAMATYTHHGYDLHLSETVAAVSCDLFFAKGVSLLYAIHTEDLFADVLAHSRVAVFDYTFTVEPRIHDVVGTGLAVTYLNFDECRERLTRGGKKLILTPYTLRTYHRSPDKVSYDCIYGDAGTVDQYVAELGKRVERFEAVWGRPLVRPMSQ
jgi:hypothetical protein